MKNMLHEIDRVASSFMRSVSLPFPGRGRLSQLLSLGATQEAIHSITLPGELTFSMALQPRQFIDRCLHYSGVWEPMETRHFMALLGQGCTVLDIGANIGYYTLIASRLVGASGRVFAFEPGRQTFARLSKNVAVNNLENTYLNDCALGDQTCEVTLYHYPGNDRGSNSLFLIERSGSETVQMTTLDSFILQNRIAHIDLVKMDVEGAEVKVLRGGMGLFSRRDAPFLMVEVSPACLQAAGTSADELVSMLREFGYRMSEITPDGLRKMERWERETYGNILAIKP